MDDCVDLGGRGGYSNNINMVKIIIDFRESFRCCSVIRAWDQEVCFLCGLRFEPCDYSYDGHWRLTWLLTLGSVELVKIRAS